MSTITNADLQQIKTQLIRRNSILRQFTSRYNKNQWDALAIDIKTLTDEERIAKYPVGSSLDVQYTYTDDNIYTMPWIIVENNRMVEWEDGTIHPALILQSQYATKETVVFDENELIEVHTAEEPNRLADWDYWGVYNDGSYNAVRLEWIAVGEELPSDAYDSIHKYGLEDAWESADNGYPRYLYSAARQWLNVDDTATFGDWWTEQHLGDVAPNPSSGRYGAFLPKLDPDFVDIVTPIKVQTVWGDIIDTTYDKFFLPSLEEMGYDGVNSTSEGTAWSYWTTDATKLTTALDDPNGTNVEYWFRSAYTSKASVYKKDRTNVLDFEIDRTEAKNALRTRPACAIS